MRGADHAKGVDGKISLVQFDGFDRVVMAHKESCGRFAVLRIDGFGRRCCALTELACVAVARLEASVAETVA